MITKAYAKINLVLRVKGVLDNGYHDLEMLNTRVNLFDKIIIKKAKKDTFKMTPLLCDNDKNIANIAYIKLKEKYNINNSYSIYIKKNIPEGAGLAGGSADAAGVIKAILKLENLKIEESELIDFALTIGSDVPYCLYNEKCVVKGVGEIIEKIDINKDWNALLIYPGLCFNTKNIFENFKQSDCSANLVSNIKDLSTIEKEMYNDLELSAKTTYPLYQLDQIKKDLINNGAIVSLMSGSGSTVYGLFSKDNLKDYKKCLLFMKRKYNNCTIIKCKTISY